jgi:hypothetical protein
VYTSELPDAVQKAWGPEAAKDFVAWLDEYLREARLAPEVQVSAFVARQKVNVLMLEQVSNLLLAGEPRLVQRSGGQWVWQVPVDFTLPSHGRVGCVGELDVDARYGEMRYTDALLAQIADKARCLAEQVLHPTADE